MELSVMEEAMKVLDYSLSHIKWRLKSHAKRRLQMDILALCTEMRPVIMVDYGGKMPELQEHLCVLINLCRQESAVFGNLRVMVIDDMIYLIHVRELANYVKLTLNSEVKLFFVNLEQDPPKIVTQEENCSLGTELIRVQNLFSSFFPIDGMNGDRVATAESFIHESSTSQSPVCIDLSCCMQDTQVTVPTLNGWLLCYPVVYLFSKEHIADAIYNLSTKSLRIFRIMVCRNVSSNRASQQEELISFSVPYELSMGGENEPWAEAFVFRMRTKWEKCKQIWSSLQMEVCECYPQAIVL